MMRMMEKKEKKEKKRELVTHLDCCFQGPAFRVREPGEGKPLLPEPQQVPHRAAAREDARTQRPRAAPSAAEAGGLQDLHGSSTRFRVDARTP